MAKRGRPKGSLNKKTLEKIAKTAVKEESLPSAVDDAADVMSGYEPKSKLGATQEKILKGPDVKETKKLNHQEQFQTFQEIQVL